MGKKGRKTIRLTPVPLREDSELKGDYTGRDPPWGVSGLNQRLGTLVLDYYTG